MPLSTAAIGGIAAGVGAIGSAGLNSMSSGKMNKRTLAWNRENFMHQDMLNLRNWFMQNERSDELWNRQNEYDTMLWNRQNQYDQEMWHKQNEYNLGLWHMQNQYNSPAAQMERYKEAGLNPHLIYGQNNMAGTVSTANLSSAPARRSEAKQGGIDAARYGSWNPRAPHYDFGSGIMAMAAFREQSARTNNLAKQNEVLDEEVAFKAAQTTEALARAANATFDLGLKKQLEKVSVDSAHETYRKLRISSDIALSSEERAAAMHSYNVKHAVQQIANMRQDNLNKAQEYKLKQFDIQLRDAGIHQDSPAWLKAIGHWYQMNVEKNPNPTYRNLGRGAFDLMKRSLF